MYSNFIRPFHPPSFSQFIKIIKVQIVIKSYLHWSLIDLTSLKRAINNPI